MLVSDDTDLLVLLCYHVSLESHDLLFCPEPKKSIKQPRVLKIKAVKQRLVPDTCQHILFLDAVLGCDRTSRLHGIGKGASLEKYQTNNAFREQMLHTHSASTHDVTCAAAIALVFLYNGISTDTLDSIRRQRFRERKKHQMQLTFIHRPCHQRQPLFLKLCCVLLYQLQLPDCSTLR